MVTITDSFWVLDETGKPIDVASPMSEALRVQDAYQHRTHRTHRIVPATLRVLDTPTTHEPQEAA